MTEQAHPSPRTVTLVSHAVIVDGQDNFGPAHNVVDYLVAHGVDVDFVLHPMSFPATGLSRSYRGGRLAEVRAIRYGRGARVREAVRNAWLGAQGRSEVLVAVDPLSFATAGLARKLRRRGGVVVYFTADYADRRFSSSILNRLYHALDRAALRKADVVWNVSNRITEKRRRQGVADADNLCIPNSPAFDPSLIVPFEARTPASVVMVGSLDSILDETMLLDCLEMLRQRWPNLSATIIGTGSGEVRFRAEVQRRGLEENVRLTGYLPRVDALAIVRESRVGLAFYSGRAAWSEYGDSVKVREYLAYGVPVVSTRNHAVASELEARGAGVLVDDGGEAAGAIDSFLGGAGAEAARRAAEMGQAYDRDAILGRAVADLVRRLRS